MKQLGHSPQNERTDKPTEKACVESAAARTISPEQLRLWLSDRRSRLKRERVELLAAADRIRKEIATYDQLLAELTTR